MKKLLLYIFIVFCVSYSAQGQVDSTKSIYYSWKINTLYNQLDSVPMDSSINTFQIKDEMRLKTLSHSGLGNFGLGGISNIFSDRDINPDLIFEAPFQFYITKPKDVIYYHTNKPKTNVFYSNISKNENFIKIFHTQNINRNFNAGVNYFLNNSIGKYQRQTANNFELTLFTSYINNRYSMHANYMVRRFRVFNNGGIVNDEITDTTDFPIEVIPINLKNSQTELKTRAYFVTQKYNLGKKITYQEDTVTKTKHNSFGSISHTFKLEDKRRDYTDANDTSFYSNIFYNQESTFDTISKRDIHNTLMFNLNDGDKKRFNTSLSFGASNVRTVYFNNFDILSLETNSTYALAKLYNTGDLKWAINTKYGVVGFNKGDRTIIADINKWVTIKDDSLKLSFNTTNKKISPDYFEQTYYSNHFRWDSTFIKKESTEIKFDLYYPKWRIDLGIDYAILDNFIYFNSDALPEQNTKTFNVLSLHASKHLEVNYFHWVNSIVYQKSSSDVIRIPEIALRSSLYYQRKIKNRYRLQVGVDLNYYTEYYAYAYSPATSQFILQDEKKLGSYPYLDAYINIQIKQVRLFGKFEHVNSGLTGSNYFDVLHYPNIIRTFRFGVSWMFNN